MEPDNLILRRRWPLGLSCLVLLWMVAGCSDGSLTLKGQYADSRPGVAQTGGDTDEPATPGGRVVEGGLSLEVQSPINGELFAQKGVMVRGSARGVAALKINDRDVEVTDGVFEHTAVFQEEGDQVVTVQAEGLPTVTVPIKVDLKPPTIEITSPQRGTFLQQGVQDQIQIQGRVTDTVSRVQELTIYGQTVPVGEDGSFTHSVLPSLGANLLDFQALDEAGHSEVTRRGVVYGQYEPWDALVGGAMSARLGEAAFPVLEQAMTSVLGGDLVSDFAGEGNGDFTIESLTYQSVDLDLTPQSGYMDMRVAINDLIIEFKVRQRILFIPVTVSGEITVDPAILNGKLYLQPDGQGSVAVSFGDTDVDLQNFDVDIDGILGIFDGLIRGFVEDLAKDLLQEALDGLALDSLGSLAQNFELLGRQAALDIWVDQISVDPQGLTFVSDSALFIEGGTDVMPSPGALRTPSQAPTGSGDKMVRFSVADDFLNQLLGNLWRTGVLNVNIGELLAGSDSLPVDLNAGTFSLLVGQELLDYAERDTPIGLSMRPQLPPVAHVQSPEDGVLKVIISDMLLDFSLEEPGAAPVPWATVSSHLILYVHIGFDDQGELAVEMTPEVYVEVIDEPLFDFDDAVLENTIASLLMTLPETLTEGDGLGGLLGGGEEEPSPLVIRNTEVRADGTGKDFMSFYLDMVPAY